MSDADVSQPRQNSQDLLRRRNLEAVSTVLEEELREALSDTEYATDMHHCAASPSRA